MEYVYIYLAGLLVGGYLSYRFGRYVEAKAQSLLKKL